MWEEPCGPGPSITAVVLADHLYMRAGREYAEGGGEEEWKSTRVDATWCWTNTGQAAHISNRKGAVSELAGDISEISFQ